MAKSFIKRMSGMTGEQLLLGTMGSDPQALSPFQTDAIQRFTIGMKFEQAQYLPMHPEVGAMLKIIIHRLTHETQVGTEVVPNIAMYFMRPTEEIDKDIRKYLNLPPNVPYCQEEQPPCDLIQYRLYRDLYGIVSKYYPRDKFEGTTPEAATPITPSSSFISQITSPSTPLTPEPEPEKPITMSEIIFKMVSNTLDKATLLKVTDEELKYDMAYVELMQAVENAMEIPVIEIRKDIIEMYHNAYRSFEYNIMAKEKLEAAVAWEKRMRKKLKRLVRRQKNFKGYETPPSKSDLSSHPSYKIPPPRPCVCHPQWKYNRYPKDRYGIYLASEKVFNDCSITAAPVMADEGPSEENVEETAEVVVKK